MSGLRRLLPRSLGRPTFRGSELREAFASFGIIIVLTVAVIWSIPGAPIKDAMAPPLQPIARFTGLDQTWGMFSPNPPLAVPEVETAVLYDSGARRVWKLEGDRSLAGQFHWDRWRKFKEQLINEPVTRPAYALWVARKMMRPGEHPVGVTIFSDTRKLRPPGSNAPEAHEQKILYDWKFGPAS
ncbi:hypothetical protein OS121_07530 [Mycolicibacterium mucogenicum]|uniref:hypothetical protein n=1 Tax=Mycolicibacterium mucogenicum TaxID=56689 RepID=UPI00226A60B5|nr:hypothetical protein [Mycolicibacterium mucogenicum]MCX8554947.1 hypothetical protein [Mycolicibacterium mucogenicum]